jgi:hypothetical protein
MNKHGHAKNSFDSCIEDGDLKLKTLEHFPDQGDDRIGSPRL